MIGQDAEIVHLDATQEEDRLIGQANTPIDKNGKLTADEVLYLRAIGSGVSVAELIMPAADLSEQISTAGTEASGTGNMKFAMNGAITIGTWDGANIEMAQAMGVENMFVFGLRAEGVQKMKQLGYDPKLYVDENRQLRAVMDAIADGSFAGGDTERYRPIVDNLMHRDGYLLMADFADYAATQLRVDALFRDDAAWAAQAIRNVAGMGWFSSDRTIAEYVERVWSADSLR